MRPSPSDLTLALLDAAKKAGADTADAIAVTGTALSIDVRDGKLEQAERAEGSDIGLRVFVGQRSAVVSASDTRPETMQAMAERAVAMAKEAPEDPYAGIADPSLLATDWDVAALELMDPSAEPAPAELQDDARRAEAAAQANPGVTQVQSASASYSLQDVALAASNGFAGGYQRSSRSLSCVAIAGEGLGMERDYDGDSRTFQADLRSAEEIGQSAAERAVARLNPKRPKTGSYPVLFDERISSSLVGHLMAAINGGQIARGASWLRDAMGEQVLPDHMSLIEDPHRPRAGASRPFDAEGLPTRKRRVIDNGTLTGWTLDLANARKLGLDSSGNAARSVTGGVSPVAWNLELTQGDASRDELIAQMGTGLLVTSMIGSTINPNTGDYSRGAAGLWIENGEIAYPVSGVTIAGNLREMLRRIIPANDARPYLSRVVPSLLVEGLTLAGE
ncbi:TldD/PmbA family protein [Tropicibacter naphthalenivorans]|uniref:Peptidase PmbA n=1 Tax=Tropicibacter naphthalenivorans TaxID=441103 RepID=A0A0P1G131_9RHOB|nr:TldD/PmbA family protein [Tropicibacter naphthalenivorans]CUH75469.1 peptidase PmbA [Tropicibacter naphthalenivorans]SMC44306.1 PmbA protein [Tropicibacter naphthalenivorans]